MIFNEAVQIHGCYGNSHSWAVAHPMTHENGRSSILALPSHRVEATNFCHELSQIKFVLIRAHNSWPIFEAGIKLTPMRLWEFIMDFWNEK
jgi:hypothetical protein